MAESAAFAGRHPGMDCSDIFFSGETYELTVDSRVRMQLDLTNSKLIGAPILLKFVQAIPQCHQQDQHFAVLAQRKMSVNCPRDHAHRAPQNMPAGVRSP